MNILHKIVSDNSKKLFESLIQNTNIKTSLFADNVKKVCDVGIGSGVSAKTLLQMRTSIQIKGLDVEDALWKENKDLSVDVYDGKNFPYRDNSFDNVLIFLVLHHADNPKAVLEESKRITKNNVLIVEELKKGFFQNCLWIIYDVLVNLFIFGHMIQIPKFKSEEDFSILFGNLELDVKEYLVLEESLFKKRVAYLLAKT